MTPFSASLASGRSSATRQLPQNQPRKGRGTHAGRVGRKVIPEAVVQTANRATAAAEAKSGWGGGYSGIAMQTALAGAATTTAAGPAGVAVPPATAAAAATAGFAELSQAA